MLAFADAVLARMVIAPGRVFLSRGRGHARAASNGLLTHGILPTKSTTAAATPCPTSPDCSLRAGGGNRAMAKATTKLNAQGLRLSAVLTSGPLKGARNNGQA